jgi:L-asparaginase
MSAEKPMHLAIFTAGGTIDKVYFDAKGGFEVGAPMVEQILQHGRVTDFIPVVELLRKDSLEMTESDRMAILEAVTRSEATRVIVTPFNLGMAMAAVQVLPPGVFIVANGRVFEAGRVRKNAALNRFEATDTSA